MIQRLTVPSRLTVDQYHELIRNGTLTKDDPVELLEGELVTKMPKSPAHCMVTQLTRAALAKVVPAGWYVPTQAAVTLDDSEPEPDVMIVRGEPRDYPDRHPGPQDVALVVEIAHSSLDRDQTLKKRLYARTQFPVYWIVNIPDRQLEVYTEPSGPAEEPDYRKRQDYGPSDTVPVVLDGHEIGRIAVAQLLP